MVLCSNCNERPVHIKKRGLCKRCYQRQRMDDINRKTTHDPILPSKDHQAQVRNFGEIAFIKNFFNHNNWIWNPCTFNLNGINYTPDFYDGERNVFIEVASTRQAYHYNKDKYALFRIIFQKIELEVRTPDGNIVGEDSKNIWQCQYNKLQADPELGFYVNGKK